ncbi:DMT family transporter [Kiloniella laminariae]|uniref:DMT family transporter n=1 Tax=Kiloniella laminariae TaxID=454162 RepID=UPI00047724F7|nr:DMT family transporter [Kiloniella laminariae]
MQQPQINSGILQMSLAMVLSGFIGLFVFESGQSPFNVVFFRCVFGATGLGLYCWYKGYLTKEVWVARNITLALLGGAALVCNWILLFSSFELASISVSTTIYHTQPFFLVIFGAIFLGEAFSLNKMIWLIIAFSGLVLIVNPDTESFAGNIEMLKGAGLALGAAVLYTITTIVTKRLKQMKPHLIAFLQVSLGVVMLAPFVDLSAAPSDVAPWGFLIALGLIHTCFMYIIMYSAFQKLQTPVIAVLSFIYPVVAIIVDYVFYEQNLSMMQILGIVLILLSAAAVNLGWKLLPGRNVPAKKTA